jgi:hypothetical protein
MKQIFVTKWKLYEEIKTTLGLLIKTCGYCLLNNINDFLRA